MEKLIFATNNANKVEEINAIIGNLFEVVSLKAAGIDIEIPEPHDTLEANASEKSRTIYKLMGQNCFSEDTGLEVEALQGAPGVKSARYAGDDSDFNKNINKLLYEMGTKPNRGARFRTVISLILHEKEYQFEGICKGIITKEPSGNGGFGYDPVFVPNGSHKTFADMTLEEKNQYSHRQKATSKLVNFLSQLGTSSTK
jgi:XTP/dITP diphosphohydrolase